MLRGLQKFVASSVSETMLKLLSSIATPILSKDTTINFTHRNYTWKVTDVIVFVDYL